MKVAQRTVAYALSTRVQTTLLMVLQSVAFTRILGVEGRGLYAKLQAGLNLSVLLFGFGLTAALSTYLANKKVKTAEALSLAFWVWILAMVAVGAVLRVFALWPQVDLIFPTQYHSADLGWYFFLSFGFTLLQQTLSSALLGHQRFDGVNRLDLWTTVARTALFAGLWFSARQGGLEVTLPWAFGLDLSLVALKALVFSAAFRREFSAFGLPLGLTRQSVIIMLRFSFFVYVTSVLTFLYLRIDYWLVERTLGLSALGIYSVAAGLAQYMTIVPMALASIMGPLVASARSQGGDSTETLKYFSRPDRLIS